MQNLENLLPLKLTPPFKHLRGSGYQAELPNIFKDFANTPDNFFNSSMRILEDGRPLKLPFGDMLNIYYCGGGAYNHWSNILLFSTSDNTDPNTNGRTYEIVCEKDFCGSGTQPFPKRVHIELSRSCNIYCRMCRDTPYKAPFMDKNLFDKIAEELLPHAAELRMDGGGELLLHPELPRIIKKVSELGQPFFSSSNGMLMSENTARMLAESTLHHIQISVDSPVKETFEWIRRGAKFDRVIKGVRHLVEARKNVGRPFLITFHAAVMRENVAQLPDLVRLAHNLGIEGVTANHLFCHEDVTITPDSSCFWDQAQYDEMREKAIETARELDSFFYGPAPFSSASTNNLAGGNYCLYPENGVYILPNGDVAPCCGEQKIIFGNLQNQSFSEIWNGEKYAKLRQTYRGDKPFVPKCKGCITNIAAVTDWHAYFAPKFWKEIKNRHSAA